MDGTQEQLRQQLVYRRCLEKGVCLRVCVCVDVRVFVCVYVSVRGVVKAIKVQRCGCLLYVCLSIVSHHHFLYPSRLSLSFSSSCSSSFFVSSLILLFGFFFFSFSLFSSLGLPPIGGRRPGPPDKPALWPLPGTGLLQREVLQWPHEENGQRRSQNGA